MPPTFEKKCRSCGTRYRVKKLYSFARDKDSIVCKCGEELLSWNGGVYYYAEP